MAKPRPTPLYCLVVEESTCVKTWNNRFWSLLEIPIPVSMIEHSIDPILSWGSLLSLKSINSKRISIEPSLVNLIALPIRFRKICLIRPGSDSMKVGTSSSMLINKSTDFSFNCSWDILITSAKSLRISKFCLTISNCPASIFEKSKMSSTSRSRLSPLF